MIIETDNAFIQILRRAIKEKWCIQPYSTTCGTRDFRSALRDSGGELEVPLANTLADINLDELTVLPRWDSALEIAVRDLPIPGQAYSRPDVTEALELSTYDWNRAIRQLKAEGKVVQIGERRGARYRLCK